MLVDLDDIAKRTAALLDDPSQSDFDRDYLLPFINQRWDSLNVTLMMLGLKYTEQIVVLNPNNAGLPANTTNLSVYQAAGQALASLMLPKKVEWKLVGDPDTAYKEAAKMDVMPDLDPTTQGISAWVWRNSTLYISPSSIAIVVRVTFEAMSTTLVDPTDNVYRGTMHIIALRVAELVWFIRGNKDMSIKMQQDAQAAEDDFEVLCVMSNQKIVRRFGRMSRRNRLKRRVVGVQV